MPPLDSPVEDFVAADIEFHRKIAGLAQFGAGLARRQHVRANYPSPNLAGMTEPRAQAATLAEHRAIYNAIMNKPGDGDLAVLLG